MNKSHKVKATHVQQVHSAARKTRVGVPVKAANSVPQKAESAKKNVARSTAGRKGMSPAKAASKPAPKPAAKKK